MLCFSVLQSEILGLLKQPKRTLGYRSLRQVPLKPFPRRQGKCRNTPEDEQMQEEVGLEMFESVPTSGKYS